MPNHQRFVRGWWLLKKAQANWVGYLSHLQHLQRSPCELVSEPTCFLVERSLGGPLEHWVPWAICNLPDLSHQTVASAVWATGNPRRKRSTASQETLVSKRWSVKSSSLCRQPVSSCVLAWMPAHRSIEMPSAMGDIPGDTRFSLLIWTSNINSRRFTLSGVGFEDVQEFEPSFGVL